MNYHYLDPHTKQFELEVQKDNSFTKFSQKK